MDEDIVKLLLRIIECYVTFCHFIEVIIRINVNTTIIVIQQ